MIRSMRESVPPLLLVVEDNDEDFAVLKRIVEQTSVSCQIDRCMTGEEALDYLLLNQELQNPDDCRNRGGGLRPSLILLDLSLPGTDGQDLLSCIKQNAALRAIPIVVLSGTLNQKEVNWLYQQGISGYIVKQVDGAKFKRNMQLLIEYWFVANRLPN